MHDDFGAEYNLTLREDGDWVDDRLRPQEPSAAKWEHPTLGFIEFARFHLAACKSDAETAGCLEDLAKQLTRQRNQFPSFDLAQVLNALPPLRGYVETHPLE